MLFNRSASPRKLTKRQRELIDEAMRDILKNLPPREVDKTKRV